MSFSNIAHVYDRFNDLESYEQWLDFTLNSLATPPHKVLDVACGTGWFSQLLAPFCEEITAFDLDDKMIEIAQREQGNTQNVQYSVANMLDLSQFDTDYDLATCYADSLCFLSNAQEVTKAIEQIANKLKRGGTFLFDVWSEYQLSVGFDGFNYFDSDDAYALLWDSEVNAETLSVSHYLTVFHRDEASQLYHRTDTELNERTYPLSIYKQALQKAGFQQIEVLVHYGLEHYDPQKHQEVDRLFFRCVKG